MDKGKTAVVGMNREYQAVRLNGMVEKLEDPKYWIDRIFEANPSMNDVYPGDSRYILDPFCISHLPNPVMLNITMHTPPIIDILIIQHCPRNFKPLSSDF